MLESDLIFAAHVLDPRIKLTMIKEQYGNQANNIIDCIKSFFQIQYLSTFPIQTQTEVEITEKEKLPGVSIHY
jgi:hypothetical protein